MVLLVCMVVIAAVSSRNLLQSDNIAVLNDEFGYWGIAASLAGKDWSALLGYTPYYSFGYSLLLVPLFWLGLDMATMYHLALGLNVVLLLLAFLTAVHVLRQLFPSHSRSFCVLAAFCSTVYTNNLVQAQGAWTETLLFFLFWLILWQVIRTCRNATALNVILLAILGSYNYAVHMRTLGIVVSLFLVIIGLRWIKKIKIRNLILFIAVLVLGMAANEVVKTFLQENYFTSTALSSTNDYSGQTEKLAYIFTSLEGFLSFLSSIVGKIFYFETSTLIVGGIGIGFCLIVSFQVVKKILAGQIRQIKVVEFPCVYLSLAFLSTFAIAAISAWAVTYHLEVAVYGRYMEFTFGPLIAIGIVLLVDHQVSLRTIATHLAVLLVAAIVTNQTLLQTYSLGQKDFNWLCIASWKRIYEVFSSLSMFPFFLVVVCAAIFFLGWSWCCWVNAHKERFPQGNYRLVGVFGVTVCLSCAWIWAALGETAFETHQVRTEVYLSGVENLFANAGQIPSEVTILLDENDDLSSQYQLKYVQTEYPDLKMNVTNVAQWNGESTDIVFTLPGSTASDKLYADYLCVDENSWFSMYVKTGTVWEKAAARTFIDPDQIEFYQMKVGQDGMREDLPVEVTVSNEENEDALPQTNVQMDCMISGDDKGSLFGPYISLPRGKYAVEFEMNVLANRSGQQNVAQCIVQAELGEQNLGQVQVQANATGKLSARIEFDQTQELLSNIEFVIQPTTGVDLEISSINLIYLEEIHEIFVQDSDEIRRLERYLQMDPENMPLYCVLPPKESDCTTDALQQRFPERRITVVTQVEDIADRNAILLIDTGYQDAVQSLLSKNTILAKIGQYTLMIPSTGEMIENYLAHGGAVLSKGDALSFRYFASGNETGASSLAASLPAGKYELLYQISFSSDLELEYGTIYCEVGNKMVYQQKISEQEVNERQYSTTIEVILNEADKCQVSLSGNLSSNVTQFNVYMRRTGDVEPVEPLE